MVEYHGGCDVILVDYADLLKPKARREDRRFELTDLYENLRGLAGELQIPIWTASQSNRMSVGSRVLGIDSVAEDFNKVAIADIAITVNQTREEIIGHRLRYIVVGSRIGESNVVVECSADWKTSSVIEVQEDFNGRHTNGTGPAH